MVANKEPIFTLVPEVSQVVIGTQNNRSDGNGTIGTDIFLLFSAGADGSFIQYVSFMPVTTTGGTGTNTAATVLRVYISTASSGATSSSNTRLLGELTAGVVSAGNSTTAVNPLVLPLNFALQSGQHILVTTHIAHAANTSWHATCVSGDY
jgi:hypothetical protein